MTKERNKVQEMILPQITMHPLYGNTTRVLIAPLLPGYGVTIGHPLQKALLSLPGAAITMMRIEGLHNGMQTIPGIDEDVTDLVLNLKQVRLCCDVNQPVTLYLNVHGVGEVTAADIICPESVEIVNPEAHIATLTHAHAHLVMELTVTQGKGYVPVPQSSLTSTGSILLDAIYTPVVQVSYTIEPVRVGNAVNYDKIVLDLTTDGTISPDEALQQAGTLLTQLLLTFTDAQVDIPEPRPKAASGVRIPADVYDLPLDALGLSTRISNSLRRSGNITMVGQLLTMEEEELRSIRNIGDKALQEIVDRLWAMGCFVAIAEKAL